MTTTTASPHQGKFRYLTRGAKPAATTEAYLLPPLSEFGDVVNLPLTDLKPSLDFGDESPYKLSVHGFTARRHHSTLHAAPYNRASWNDEKLLREVHFPEMQAFVQQLTGCKTAVVSSVVVRKQLYSEGAAPSDTKSPESEKKAEEKATPTEEPFPPIFGLGPTDGICPAPKVHLDLTPKGARYHIRKYHHTVTSAAVDVIEAENRLLESGVQWHDLKDHYAGPNKTDGQGGVPRFALFSIWRPLKTVHRDPLALSSCASYPESDYVPSAQLEPKDHRIPPHLSRIVDPNAPNSTIDTGDTDTTYITEGYLAHAPRDKEQTSHAWHYIPEQEPSDVLVIQLFDNEMEAHSRAPKEGGNGSSNLGVGGAIHTAFEFVGQDESVEARESIEVRVAAFW